MQKASEIPKKVTGLEESRNGPTLSPLVFAPNSRLISFNRHAFTALGADEGQHG
jgi:hypothetical protein